LGSDEGTRPLKQETTNILKVMHPGHDFFFLFHPRKKIKANLLKAFKRRYLVNILLLDATKDA
jgi:hypothetical protein